MPAFHASLLTEKRENGNVKLVSRSACADLPPLKHAVGQITNKVALTPFGSSHRDIAALPTASLDSIFPFDVNLLFIQPAKHQNA